MASLASLRRAAPLLASLRSPPLSTRLASTSNPRASAASDAPSSTSSSSSSSTSNSVNTVDEEEIRLFSSLSAEWWNEAGEFRFLHSLNPVRVAFIRSVAAEAGLVTRPAAAGSPIDAPQTGGRPPRALDGLRILDIGCGGGILSEALARLGAKVVGVDAAADNIAVAQRHMGLDPFLAGRIDYRAVPAETLATAGEQFDVVVGSEVVEHVTEPKAFVGVCAQLLRPQGVLVISTINKTVLSRLLAITLAEDVFGWVSRGTHTHEKFVSPEDLRAMFQAHGLSHLRTSGLALNPLRNRWAFAQSVAVNYITAATKPGPQPEGSSPA